MIHVYTVCQWFNEESDHYVIDINTVCQWFNVESDHYLLIITKFVSGLTKRVIVI